jgi:hypothetical protein
LLPTFSFSHFFQMKERYRVPAFVFYPHGRSTQLLCSRIRRSVSAVDGAHSRVSRMPVPVRTMRAFLINALAIRPSLQRTSIHQ